MLKPRGAEVCAFANYDGRNQIALLPAAGRRAETGGGQASCYPGDPSETSNLCNSRETCRHRAGYSRCQAGRPRRWSSRPAETDRARSHAVGFAHGGQV